MGMKIGPIENLQNRMDEFLDYVDKSPDGLAGIKPIAWFMSRLGTKSGTTVDPYDEKEMHTPFSREELDGRIKRVYNDKEALLVEMVDSELQTAWLSSFERDFRWRYRSRIRIMAHEYQRRKVHADPNGTIRQGPERVIKNLGKQGSEIKPT